MASFMSAFLVFVSLLTLLEGVSIVRDDVDTIILDDSDWNIFHLKHLLQPAIFG